LADFGFTITEGDNVVGGTLHYLPQEQQEGQPAKKASDVFSAAFSMFEVLSKKKVNMKSKQGTNLPFEEIWDEHLKSNHHFHRKNSQPHANQLFKLFRECLHVEHTKRMSAKQVTENISQIYRDYSATLLQKQFRGYRTRKSLSSENSVIKI